MANIIAWPLDILLRVTKRVRGKRPLQPLLAVYNDPPVFESPTAMALASGDSFPGVHTGASGLGYTVLTRGLVCFGKPRDGPACFLLASDYRMIGPTGAFVAIKRGAIEIDDEGNPELKFRDVGGGAGLLALTFAGKAFHAAYFESGSTTIATSFDGVRWDSQDSAFPSSEMGTIGGAVAFNDDNYAAAGNAQVDPPDETPVWGGAIENLAWATAAAPPSPPPPEPGDPPPVTPLSWGYGFVSEPRGNPGAIMMRTGVEDQQATIAGGNGIFAAATFKKEVEVVGEDEFAQQQIIYTAAIAASSSGSAWDNHMLDGVQEGLIDSSSGEGGESRTMAVIFLQDKKKEDSFFVCATYNFYSAGGSGTTWGTVHKSYDAKNWTLVRSIGSKGDGGKNFCSALSVIDANPDNTTIIYL